MRDAVIMEPTRQPTEFANALPFCRGRRRCQAYQPHNKMAKENEDHRNNAKTTGVNDDSKRQQQRRTMTMNGNDE
eukprot:CAMPEP_0181108026 /NCGR_PEP_ID=MMETSP1071-20121207/17403_1 /TAXON_ID=35127 /ORGANISM="Thalassiosira sp., Strain NH16" /LENGTH=74 /DNA_ID=CAMNT_0023191587 /DNA_START=279 /DNA_END=503 /DNA_ORIENTATION=-